MIKFIHSELYILHKHVNFSCACLGWRKFRSVSVCVCSRLVTCCQLYVCLCLEYLIEQTRHAVGALGCIKDTCEEYGKDKKGGYLRGRSQLSTFMKACTAYPRGRGSGTTVRFRPRKSTFNFNH